MGVMFNASLDRLHKIKSQNELMVVKMLLLFSANRPTGIKCSKSRSLFGLAY